MPSAHANTAAGLDALRPPFSSANFSARSEDYSCGHVKAPGELQSNLM
jgi:hypothetical protein